MHLFKSRWTILLLLAVYTGTVFACPFRKLVNEQLAAIAENARRMSSQDPIGDPLAPFWVADPAEREKNLKAWEKQILDAAEERERQRVAAMHERILGLLAKSREEGFDVTRLEPAAAHALRLNVKQRRPEAIRILNQLEMDIPRKKVQYIPMNPEEEKLDIPPDIQPAPPKKHTPKRKPKANRSRNLD